MYGQNWNTQQQQQQGQQWRSPFNNNNSQQQMLMNMNIYGNSALNPQQPQALMGLRPRVVQPLLNQQSQFINQASPVFQTPQQQRNVNPFVQQNQFLSQNQQQQLNPFVLQQQQLNSFNQNQQQLNPFNQQQQQPPLPFGYNPVLPKNTFQPPLPKDDHPSTKAKDPPLPLLDWKLKSDPDPSSDRVFRNPSSGVSDKYAPPPPPPPQQQQRQQPPPPPPPPKDKFSNSSGKIPADFRNEWTRKNDPPPPPTNPPVSTTGGTLPHIPENLMNILLNVVRKDPNVIPGLGDLDKIPFIKEKATAPAPVPAPVVAQGQRMAKNSEASKKPEEAPAPAAVAKIEEKLPSVSASTNSVKPDAKIESENNKTAEPVVEKSVLENKTTTLPASTPNQPGQGQSQVGKEDSAPKNMMTGIIPQEQGGGAPTSAGNAPAEESKVNSAEMRDSFESGEQAINYNKTTLKVFDKKFRAWEKQFEDWKQSNQNHPDKMAYKKYMDQWDAWRQQLIGQRRFILDKINEAKMDQFKNPDEVNQGDKSFEGESHDDNDRVPRNSSMNLPGPGPGRQINPNPNESEKVPNPFARFGVGNEGNNANEENRNFNMRNENHFRQQNPNSLLPSGRPEQGQGPFGGQRQGPNSGFGNQNFEDDDDWGEGVPEFQYKNSNVGGFQNQRNFRGQFNRGVDNNRFARPNLNNQFPRQQGPRQNIPRQNMAPDMDVGFGGPRHKMTPDMGFNAPRQGLPRQGQGLGQGIERDYDDYGHGQDYRDPPRPRFPGQQQNIRNAAPGPGMLGMRPRMQSMQNQSRFESSMNTQFNSAATATSRLDYFDENEMRRSHFNPMASSGRGPGPNVFDYGHGHGHEREDDDLNRRNDFEEENEFVEEDEDEEDRKVVCFDYGHGASAVPIVLRPIEDEYCAEHEKYSGPVEPEPVDDEYFDDLRVRPRRYPERDPYYEREEFSVPGIRPRVAPSFMESSRPRPSILRTPPSYGPGQGQGMYLHGHDDFDDYPPDDPPIQMHMQRGPTSSRPLFPIQEHMERQKQIDIETKTETAILSSGLVVSIPVTDDSIVRKAPPRSPPPVVLLSPDREKDKSLSRERSKDRDRDRSRDTDRDRDRDRSRRDRSRDRDRDRRDRDRKESESKSDVTRVSRNFSAADRDRGRDRSRDRDRVPRSGYRSKSPLRYGRERERSPRSRRSRSPYSSRRSSRSRSPVGRGGTNSRTSSSSQQHIATRPKYQTLLVEDLLNLPGRAKRPSAFVVILRGLPGSGKSFVAKLIKEREMKNGGPTPRILSLDDYFMTKEIRKVAKDPATGKDVETKDMEYEYDQDLESKYRSDLIRNFKKTVDNGFFKFIIIDCINDKLKYFNDIVHYATTKKFQVYVAETEANVTESCLNNIHNRTRKDIEYIHKNWETLPSHLVKLDIDSLLQDEAIDDVEMEDVSDIENIGDDDSKQIEVIDLEDVSGAEDDEPTWAPSKWETSEEKLNKLDGLVGKKKKNLESSEENKIQSMGGWLKENLPDDYMVRPDEPGKKRVRWADIEERREQERAREIGFVVGQTNWNRLTDPTFGSSALTRTKFI